MRILALHLVSVAVVVVVLGGVFVTGGAADEPANVTWYTAENSAFEDAEAIEDAIEDGEVTPASEAKFGTDVILIALDSERLAADLDARDGTTSERFFEALDDDLTLSLVQTEPSPMMPAMNVPVGSENTTVQRNGTTTYVSIDTDAADMEWLNGGVPDAEIHHSELFALRFGYDLDEDAYTYTGPEIEFLEVGGEFASVIHSGYLPPERVNKSVGLYTEPSESATVRATLDDGTELTETVTDQPWTEYRGVSLDFRDVEPGTGYTLELLFDGEVVDERAGTVETLDASLSDPSVTLTEDEPYPAVLNVSATLSHGGFVTVTDDSGERIARAGAPAGETADLSVPLPADAEQVDSFEPEELHLEAIRDTAEGEVPYPETDANTTLDVSEYEWMTDTPTPTPTPVGHTPTPTPTETVTDSPTPTPESSPTETPERTDDVADDGGPGFTAVALLLALGAVVLAGLRRRERT